MPIQPFVTIPNAQHYWLTNTRVPLTFLEPTVPHRQVLPQLAAYPLQEELVPADIEIKGGKIRAIAPVGTAPDHVLQADLHQGLVWPCLIDMHTHLDKGHAWSRTPNPNGTFQEALQLVDQDRERYWTPEDLYQRMDFGIRCSYAHGTRAIRTHLDAFGQQAAISFEVLKALQQAWRGRMELQGVSLVTIDAFATRETSELADLVADQGGILGGVTFPHPQLADKIDWAFKLAQERGLDLDLHVDESLDPKDQALQAIAEAKLRHDFTGKVVCGHCCSLSVQTPEVVKATLDYVKAADLAIVSLPMCNLYLQDRQPQHTPRYRGITLLHELSQQGIPVALASDNCRDPFFAYGDHDGLEVFTQSVRIGHLDRPFGDWPQAVTTIPARLMGLTHPGTIGLDQPADLVLFQARSFNELIARGQSDRAVIRNGQAISTELPDYAELDALMTPTAPASSLASLIL